MHSCGSFVGQARLQFAGLHSLFLALWCIVIEIGGAMRDLLFWCLMYLYHEVICLYRCLCGNWCICTALIFIVADALLEINVSATCFSSNLQILLSLPVMYNCICILSFLVFEDTSFTNFASSILENPLSQISSLNILYVLLHLPNHIYYRISILLRSCPSGSCRIFFLPQPFYIRSTSF